MGGGNAGTSSDAGRQRGDVTHIKRACAVIGQMLRGDVMGTNLAVFRPGAVLAGRESS